MQMDLDLALSKVTKSLLESRKTLSLARSEALKDEQFLGADKIGGIVKGLVEPTSLYGKSLQQTAELIKQESAVRLASLKLQKLEAQFKLNADGVHLNSSLLHRLSEIPKDLIVSASCHSVRDIEKAMTMDVSFVVLSPVQKTQSHPNTTPIGWDDFSKITQNYSIPIYALGGMKQDDIENAFNAGAIGIASQRAIWEA